MKETTKAIEPSVGRIVEIAVGQKKKTAELQSLMLKGAEYLSSSLDAQFRSTLYMRKECC